MDSSSTGTEWLTSVPISQSDHICAVPSMKDCKSWGIRKLATIKWSDTSIKSSCLLNLYLQRYNRIGIASCMILYASIKSWLLAKCPFWGELLEKKRSRWIIESIPWKWSEHLSKLGSTQQTRRFGLCSASIVYSLLLFNQLAMKGVDCTFE